MRRNIIRKKKFQEWEEGLIKYSTSHNQRTEGRMAWSTRFGKVEGVGWAIGGGGGEICLHKQMAITDGQSHF